MTNDQIERVARAIGDDPLRDPPHIQALHAAISRRDWHAAEVAANDVRDSAQRARAALRALSEAGMVVVPADMLEVMEAVTDSAEYYFKRAHPDWDGTAHDFSTLGRARAMLAASKETGNE